MVELNTTATYLKDYLDDIRDVPAEVLKDARIRVERLLKLRWPELDTRPNSPFGDWIVTPFAYMTALHEIATGRMYSDLQLDNLARGVVYNCEFARDYLKNFTVRPAEGYLARGTVRLVFSTAQTRSLDRRTRFLFGANNVFRLHLPKPGGFLIPAPGGSVSEHQNGRTLTQTGDDRYAVDVPVVGVMPTPVQDGASATTDNLLPDTVAISAVGDFSAGTPPDSITNQARRTRETFYSAGLSSRKSTVSLLRSEFPDITGISVVLTGDHTMLRSSPGERRASMDVLAKTHPVYARDQAQVGVPWNGSRFVGRLLLPHRPVEILSIKSATDPSLNLDFTLYSRSGNSERTPRLTCARSSEEELWLVVEMPTDGIYPLIQLKNDAASFVVDYTCDPGLPAVEATLQAPDVRSPLLDVMVRGFTPVVIKSLTINYYQNKGGRLNLARARKEIFDYFSNLTGPSVYSDGPIIDTMMFAGAAGVSSIVCDAEIQFSVADRLLPESADLESDYAAAVASSILVPRPTIVSSHGLNPVFMDPDLGEADETRAAADRRSLAYVLDEKNIHFSAHSL